MFKYIKKLVCAKNWCQIYFRKKFEHDFFANVFIKLIVCTPFVPLNCLHWETGLGTHSNALIKFNLINILNYFPSE